MMCRTVDAVGDVMTHESRVMTKRVWSMKMNTTTSGPKQVANADDPTRSLVQCDEENKCSMVNDSTASYGQKY